ncbi:hypothetical protein NKI20_29350 [Mesorhizobium sp. M0830]|uniref:hypothetical protein n=1 Tax=Mesorhizobium sp. M0830 TaxID=2957008 RepID=UPI003337D143
MLLPDHMAFEWEHLVLALARTRTMSTNTLGLTQEERQRLIDFIGQNVASYIDLFVDSSSAEFCFTEKMDCLADDERTSLAGKVGAAVADLAMEQLGFHWRANAREANLKLSKRVRQATKKIPDFVYDPGAQHGFQQGSVVVVEAKGSLSRKRAKRSTIFKLAQNAYNEQVRDFIDSEGDGVVVASGYAVAFGSIPGERGSTLAIASPQPFHAHASSVVRASSLSSAARGGMQEAVMDQAVDEEEEEPLASYRFGGGDGGGRGGGRREDGERAQPSGRVAFANYESVFELCGATTAASLFRNILSGRGAEELESLDIIQDFWLVDHADGFLVGSDYSRSGWPGWGIFAIYERSAVQILEIAAKNLKSPPPIVKMAIVPDTLRSVSVTETGVAVHGDGLAYVDISHWPIHGKLMQWHLREARWI